MPQTQEMNLTPEQQQALLAELDKLRAENQEMSEKLTVGGRVLQIFIGNSGGVSVRGFGRFPVTLYGEGWAYLFSAKVRGAIEEFIDTNQKWLKDKDEDKAAYEARITKALAKNPELKKVIRRTEKE